MPFVVGLALMGLGGLLVWGGISGRLASMAGAFLPPTIKTTALSMPATGFDQVGITMGGIAPGSAAPGASSHPQPDGSYLVPNLSIDPTTGQPTGTIPNTVMYA